MTHLAKPAGLFLATALVASFLGGALVHALVPHSHEGGEVMTQQMHGALRHEDKQIAPSIGMNWLSIGLVYTALIIPVALFLRPRNRYDEILKRGIVAYRKFG